MKRLTQILEPSYGYELSKALLETYDSMEENYTLGKWKLCILDGGHFVEFIRRIIDKEVFGTMIDLKISLTRFNEGLLKKIEQETHADENFRIIIPRIIYSIYCLRNKKGVAHSSATLPSKVDAYYVLNSCKWVLAEIIKQQSTRNISSVDDIVDDILRHPQSVIWSKNQITRVLDIKVSAKNQVLLLLYKTQGKNITELQQMIEYKNKYEFRKILKNQLHKKRLIEYNIASGECLLSPIGNIEAERLIKQFSVINN
jgi:hypothetical protein